MLFQNHQTVQENYSMKTVTMLPLFLLAIHQMRYSEYLTTINQPIQQLLNTTKFSDVHLLVHDPYKNKSEVIDGIYKTVAEILPTTYIFLNNSIPAKLPSIYTSHETLLLFIYFSNNCPNLQESKNITDTITSNNNTPKVLLVTVLEEENCNFLSFLEQMWKNHILDVMILEVPKFKEDQTVIMIHQYNPFSKIYDRQRYTSSVEWFPNKLKNLYGYPVKAYVRQKASTLIPKTYYQGSTQNITIGGADAKTWDAITQTLNFTPNLLFYELPQTGLGEFRRKYDIDIMMISLPFFKDENYISNDVGYTLPLFFETWCPVVPIVYQYETLITRAVISIAISFIVTLIVWRISIILKFDQKSWRPLEIFGLLIATSVSMKPKRLIEKTIFLGLILLSSIYSTNLYSDLTTSRLHGSSQIVYKDFKELDNSGLIPIIRTSLYNSTFDNNDPYLTALKKKALVKNTIHDCCDYLAKYKNVTCFLNSKFAEKNIYSFLRRGENVMTICKNLCYAKPPVGYYVRKNLPYTKRINEILIRLQASGIFGKWYADYWGQFSLRKTHFINIDEQTESSLVSSLIRIGGCGCLLSFLVFCAEIIINRIEKRKQK
ncbi:uncharacterized protein LOC117604409 [Osmia lignaria lignaria]|uniref:uncharacterized protein LOC117604409 n=1 Tax=Osmia lignaria lignaria TaxID=1437193 RepID=UPI00402B7138